MADLETKAESIDPRVRRTRQMLQQALGKLLEEKDFDKISVQDIADAATLNRATFYDHYPDKSALLECMVGSRFHELLAQRGVTFNGCTGALKAIALGVCDYLASMPGACGGRQRQLESHMESAVIAVVRQMVLQGLRQHAAGGEVSPELLASTVSWAIYGAAKEWVQTPERCSTEQIVATIEKLVAPIFGAVAIDEAAQVPA
jgi:AcrR family transcriptional regulator